MTEEMQNKRSGTDKLPRARQNQLELGDSLVQTGGPAGISLEWVLDQTERFFQPDERV